MGTLYRQKGRLTWMLKYYRDGRPIYESSGTDIKDDARTLLRSREGAISEGKPVADRPGRLRFDEAVQDVVNDYTANGRSTVDDVRARIDRHLKTWFAGRRMTTITTPDIRAYIAARLKESAKPATINRELAVLKRAFTLAVRGGRIGTKPHIPMLAEQNVRTGFFEREAFEDVRAHLPEELRPLMTFAYLTGWRWASEIAPLTWSQVDERVKVIRLEVGTTKNREGRTFPYDVLPELAAVITGQAKRRDERRRAGVICPWVFPDADGEAITRVSEAWHEACRLAGHPGRIPHDLRRTAVRNLVRAGVSEKVAMQLTGHKTRSVFDRYDIVNEADLRAAVTRLAGVPQAPTARRRRVGNR